LIPTHELIDRDDPRCLYCHSEFDLKLETVGGQGGFHSGFVLIDRENLTCRSCGESFWIFSIVDAGNVTEIVTFSFSCKDIRVVHDYGSGFIIGSKNSFMNDLSNLSTSGNPILSPFDIDFSDKKKLYTKLKTYLTFS
jgi:hypothetical protein